MTTPCLNYKPLAELSELLAIGLQRALRRKSSEVCRGTGESSLHIPPDQSGETGARGRTIAVCANITIAIAAWECACKIFPKDRWFLTWGGMVQYDSARDRQPLDLLFGCSPGGDDDLRGLHQKLDLTNHRCLNLGCRDSADRVGASNA
jgi:hypothetical protein